MQEIIAVEKIVRFGRHCEIIGLHDRSRRRAVFLTRPLDSGEVSYAVTDRDVSETKYLKEREGSDSYANIRVLEGVYRRVWEMAKALQFNRWEGPSGLMALTRKMDQTCRIVRLTTPELM